MGRTKPMVFSTKKKKMNKHSMNLNQNKEKFD